METIYVEFLGRPSSGKSTTAFNLFQKLKHLGNIKTEFVGEYAKELVYKGFNSILDNQLAVTAEQNFREDVLKKQVEVVVTDTSILLGNIYNQQLSNDVMENLISDLRSNKSYITIFVTNNANTYDTYGRVQTKEEALELSDKIENYLVSNKIPFHYFDKSDDIEELVQLVLKTIGK